MFDFLKRGVDVRRLAEAADLSVVETCCILALPLPEGTIAAFSSRNEAWEARIALRNYSRAEEGEAYQREVALCANVEDAERTFQRDDPPARQSLALRKWIDLAATIKEITRATYRAVEAKRPDERRLGFEKWGRILREKLALANTLEEIRELLNELPRGERVDSELMEERRLITEKYSSTKKALLQTAIQEGDIRTINKNIHMCEGHSYLPEEQVAVAYLQQLAQEALAVVTVTTTIEEVGNISPLTPLGTVEYQQVQKLLQTMGLKQLQEATTIAEVNKVAHGPAEFYIREKVFERLVELASSVEELQGVRKECYRHDRGYDARIRAVVAKMARFFPA